MPPSSPRRTSSSCACPNTEVVQSFLFGESGVIGRLRQGQTVVDLSTIGYNATVEIGRALEAKGVAFLDAPISGMEARAIEGTLTVMCGGERAVFDRVKPYLDRIGNKILYMGPTGSGQLTKLINQLLFDINAAALGEILPMAAKMGLDPDLVGEVVNSGTGRSYASEFFIPRILKGHFGDGYPMSARLQGPGERSRARGQSVHSHARARGRHGHLPGGPAARARGEGQGRHGLRPRGPARRRLS